MFAKPTTENASLSSKKSTVEISIFAFAKAFGSAFEGATVNHSGSLAASAYPFMVAKGCSPNSSALSLLISTSAAAPSFIVDAFAAVTVPSFVKAARKPGIFSNVRSYTPHLYLQ